ncbi:uncharacterized protein LOC143049335 [Mytilus galloprovincialis]|uniref:uncharacterized protein LOC143049335 n=1 Tax=Mytilus galloprovincialis TaxID=29158 RepID=UPI003F7C138A
MIDFKMRNYLQLCLVIFHIKLLHAVDINKRIFPLYIKNGVRLDYPYLSVQIGRYNLVLCGLLCTNEAQCTASSLSRADFTCRLHKNVISSEVIDSDSTLVYQNEAVQTTTVTDLLTTTETFTTTEKVTEMITTTVKSTTAETVVSWPGGTYSLMKPAVGCPGTDITWLEGNRYHDTEDDQRYNGYVVSTSMTVVQDQYGNIRVYFCTKASTSGSETDWPAGNYCIMKYTTCPTGFTEGSITWDDEDNNANQKSGTLPSGVYNTDTIIYYCCRNDGSDVLEIKLPTGNPFYLLRYTGSCQKVKSMSVSEETIKWACQTGGVKTVATVKPYEDGAAEYIRLHFCYYN